MNIGIFGATGFIGGHLLDWLTCLHKVKGFSTTLQDENRKIVKGSYLSREDVDSFVKNLEIAIYAAGFVDPRMENENNELLELSLKNLERCVESFFMKNPRGLFIYLSSAGSLYPSDRNVPHDENSEVKPSGVYGNIKLKQEELIQEKFEGMNVKILRLSNVFGDPFKKNKSTGLVDRLLASVVDGNVVNIFENLNSKRDYLYIGDLCAAIEKLLAINDELSKKNVSIYNVSSHELISIYDIIFKIQSYFPQKKIKVCFTKISGESSNLVVNSKKFREETGWSPVFSFDKALMEIKKTVDKHV